MLSQSVSHTPLTGSTLAINIITQCNKSGVNGPLIAADNISIVQCNKSGVNRPLIAADNISIVRSNKPGMDEPPMAAGSVFRNMFSAIF